MNKLLPYISIFLIGLILGITIGNLYKSNRVMKSELSINTQYSTGPSVSNNLTKLTPVKIDIPKLPYLLCFRDTIYVDSVRYEVRDVDSLSILKDWLSKRYYDVTIFDIDTLGKCDINAVTQYNQLKVLGYKYTPVYRNRVSEKSNNKLDLFTGIGFTSNGYTKLSGGLFINNLGFEYSYASDFRGMHYYGISALYKFNIK